MKWPDGFKCERCDPLKGKVEVDETVVGQQEEGLRGRKNDKKKLVVVAIERKGRGIGRMYGREINDASNQSFKPFFEDHIAPEAEIKTDEWTGYGPLKETYQNLKQIPSGKKGENFPNMHRTIMMFKPGYVVLTMPLNTYRPI